MHKVFDICPPIDRDKLYGRLNIVDGTSAWLAANSCYDELKLLISTHINVKAGYRLLSAGKPELTNRAMGETMAVGIVTADIQADMYVEQAFAESAMKGFLLDAMLNEMLFSACDELEETVSAQVMHKLIFCFPGDGELDFDSQREILQASGLGSLMNVKINEAGMLIPLKSMMFIASKSSAADGAEEKEKCAVCKNIACPYRAIK